MKFQFAGQTIEVDSAETGQTINVLPMLRHPEEFHGDSRVDQVVKFGGVFEPLIGKHDDSLPKDGVIILEHHYDEAKKLMDQVNQLAQQVIKDAKLYDDLSFCQEYFNLAKAGYEMLNKRKQEFNLENKNLIPVSLERAGLVTTRLTLELGKDEKIDNEVRVVTKRTHLKAEPETYLTVTVKWRDIKKLKLADGKQVLLSDFVNPASGASGAAFLVAAQTNQVKPKRVNHWSISLTRQGVVFIREALRQMGIESQFYSVGECDELNSLYYLIGTRAVGDAGHLLRHFLPKWYKL